MISKLGALYYTIWLCAHNPIEKLPRMAAVLFTKDGRQWNGFNRYKTHPLQKKFGRNSESIYLHAEIDAICQAVKHTTIEGASLYIARVLKNGEPALAKPCVGCERAIVHFGIRYVEWTE